MTPNGRLPRTIRPTRYELTLAPDLGASTFAGSISISCEIGETSGDLTLHAVDLDITDATVTQDGRTRAAAVAVHTGSETVTLTVDGGIAAGSAQLDLQFSGRLSDGLVGFYRSTFTDDAGSSRTIAATQFEAPHARRAFPCFDEPEFKAVFSITLDVADGLTALSNGPEIGREALDGGRVRVRFGDTIPMSTYLVAFVVGPLEVTGAADADGIPVRVVHVPGKAHLTPFALDVGVFALRYFTEYYGIPYPAEKLDLVALPDFAFGAMENLGCVTFRENLLLVDRETVTEAEASNAALTIVHEIAHMWFGDLVTMKWWNGIWLNEAFATFMEHAGTDAYRPEWRTWEEFAVGRAAAMDIDALSNTRPVEYTVHTPEDAEGMFDVLTYQKGGSVVRMLEQWLGENAFRDGVRTYLDRHRLGNTETTDLWDAIESATGRPVRRIMDSWIFQPGLPQIAVARTDGEVRLTQRRFAYAPQETAASWSIPVRVRVHEASGAARTESVLLEGSSATFPAPDDARVVVNAGGEGFYRVAYPDDWRHDLLAAAVLEPLERFALVDDAWASVLTGVAPADAFLALTGALAGEPDLVVWRALAARLRDLGRLVDPEALDAYAAHVRAVAAPALDLIGRQPADGEPAATRQLRGVLFDTLGVAGRDPEIVAAARAVDHAADPEPELAAAAVTVIAHHGDVGDFERFVERARAARTPQEQLRYLYALGAFPTEELAQRAAGHAFSEDVRPQNAPFVLQRALKNRAHGAAVWATVRDRWDDVTARFTPNLVPRMLEGVTWLIDDTSVTDVPAFLASHPLHPGERIVAQHLERQQVHRATWEREHTAVTARCRGDVPDRR